MSRLSSRVLPLLIHLGSLSVLLAAWAFEIFGKMAPCILCLQQRLPHYALAALIIPSIFLFKFKLYRRIFFIAATLLMIAAAVAAFRHIGVEYAWWKGPMSCGGSVGKIGTADQFMALTRPDCTKPTIIFFGLSMATVHFLAVLPLIGLSILGLYRNFFKN